MSTTWRENYFFKRIFKGRRERTKRRKSAALFQPLNPSSGQTDFRVVGCQEEKRTLPRTPADVSAFISGQVQSRGLAPKTANRYREILCRLFNWAMEQRGIRNVILMGVHTNMCVLHRTFAIKQLVRWGVDVALIRDLTDTMISEIVRHAVAEEMYVYPAMREYLPDDEAMTERRTRDKGLTRPELAILVSYAKISLYDAINASDNMSACQQREGDDHRARPCNGGQSAHRSADAR